MKQKISDRYDDNIWFRSSPAGDLLIRKTRILGYEVMILKMGAERGDVMYQLQVPMGKTEFEKKMFDDFVFKKKHLYTARSQRTIIDNFKNFVRDFRGRKRFEKE
jgi:hypothetical protein